MVKNSFPESRCSAGIDRSMAAGCAEISLAWVHLQSFCGRFQAVAHPVDAESVRAWGTGLGKVFYPSQTATIVWAHQALLHFVDHLFAQDW